MKPWGSLSVFFRDPALFKSVLFWTCECFWYLIWFLSCSESNDALLLEISLISFFYSPVVIVEISVAPRGMAHGNAQLGFTFLVNPANAQEAGEHLVLPKIHLNNMLQLCGCWGSGESLLQPRAD